MQFSQYPESHHLQVIAQLGHTGSLQSPQMMRQSPHTARPQSLHLIASFLHKGFLQASQATTQSSHNDEPQESQYSAQPSQIAALQPVQVDKASVTCLPHIVQVISSAIVIPFPWTCHARVLYLQYYTRRSLDTPWKNTALVYDRPSASFSSIHWPVRGDHRLLVHLTGVLAVLGTRQGWTLTQHLSSGASSFVINPCVQGNEP